MDNNAKTSGSAMNALTGTKTLKNLGTAFDDEAKAYALYNLFSAAAYDEGYPNAASLFTNIAENEIQHAALWLGYMDGIGTTPENLREAAANEREDAHILKWHAPPTTRVSLKSPRNSDSPPLSKRVTKIPTTR